MDEIKVFTRKEAILSGEDITPMNRDEYFAKMLVEEESDDSGSSSNSGGICIIPLTVDEYESVGTLGMTFAEIFDAYKSGSILVIRLEAENEGGSRYVSFYVTNIEYVENYGGYINAMGVSSGAPVISEFYVTSPSDYPTSNEPNPDPDHPDNPTS